MAVGCRSARVQGVGASVCRVFSQSELYDGCLTHLGIQQSCTTLLCECHQTLIEGLASETIHCPPAWHSSRTPRESTLARPSPLEQDCLRVHIVRVLFGLPLRSLDCSRRTARRVLLFRSSVRAPLVSAARTVMRPGLAPPGTSVAASLVVPAPVT